VFFNVVESFYDSFFIAFKESFSGKHMRAFIIVYVEGVTDVTFVCDDISKEEHQLSNLLLYQINVSTKMPRLPTSTIHITHHHLLSFDIWMVKITIQKISMPCWRYWQTVD
jgi:hypothetical protein